MVTWDFFTWGQKEHKEVLGDKLLYSTSFSYSSCAVQCRWLASPTTYFFEKRCEQTRMTCFVYKINKACSSCLVFLLFVPSSWFTLFKLLSCCLSTSCSLFFSLLWLSLSLLFFLLSSLSDLLSPPLFLPCRLLLSISFQDHKKAVYVTAVLFFLKRGLRPPELFLKCCSNFISTYHELADGGRR